MTVGTDVVILIPVAHFPEIRMSAFHRLPAVNNLRELGRGYLAAIPLVSLVAVQYLPLRRHKHLVRGLNLASGRVLQYPGETRPSHVDPERIAKVFRPQP